MTPPVPQLFFGLIFAAGVAYLAWRAGALTASGAVAACVVGAVVFGVGGWRWAIPMLVFFGTSSALSRWRRAAKAELGYEKGGRRDARQVLANGGAATVCVLLPLMFPRISVGNAYLLFLAALAAANADTWGTEIGSALGGQPYDLRTGRRAARGTSGAVSMGGTLAALVGAALIGMFAPHWQGRGVVTVSGLGGALFDSVLGAVAQGQWRDVERLDRWTEKPQPGSPMRGWRWISNDMVNLGCTLLAVGIAALSHKK